jgi:hypothetical protein
MAGTRVEPPLSLGAGVWTILFVMIVLLLLLASGVFW